MAIYKFIDDNSVMHVPSRRAIYLNQPATQHTEDYLAWVELGNTADPADPPAAPPEGSATPITPPSAQLADLLVTKGIITGEERGSLVLYQESV